MKKMALLIVPVLMLAGVAAYVLLQGQGHPTSVPYADSLEKQVKSAEMILEVFATDSKFIKNQGVCEYDVTIDKALLGSVKNLSKIFQIYDRVNDRSYVSLIVGKESRTPPCEQVETRFLLFLHGLNKSDFFANGKLNPRASYMRYILDKDEVLKLLTR